LGRIKPEVLGNSATSSNGHNSSLFCFSLARICTNRKFVCTSRRRSRPRSRPRRLGLRFIAFRICFDRSLLLAVENPRHELIARLAPFTPMRVFLLTTKCQRLIKSNAGAIRHAGRATQRAL
jgi:hypothetical protein